MTIKYDRNVIVDIELENTDIIKVSEPRIAFEFSYSATDTPSEGRIVLYDLSEQTAEAVQTDARAVRVNAGYQNATGLLFDGVVRRIEHERNGLERQTRIIVGGKTIIPPGSNETTRAVSVNTAGEEIALKDAVASVVEQMGLELGDTSPLPRITSPEFYAGGEDATAVLTGWLRLHDIEWYEEKGVIQFSQRRKQSNRAITIEVSEKTGMVGTPKVEFDDDGGKSVSVKTLLNPALELGTTIDVKSEIVRGRFKTVELTHVGDNWRRDHFNTEAEGVPFDE